MSYFDPHNLNRRYSRQTQRRGQILQSKIVPRRTTIDLQLLDQYKAFFLCNPQYGLYSSPPPPPSPPAPPPKPPTPGPNPPIDPPEPDSTLPLIFHSIEIPTTSQVHTFTIPDIEGFPRVEFEELYPDIYHYRLECHPAFVNEYRVFIFPVLNGLYLGIYPRFSYYDDTASFYSSIFITFPDDPKPSAVDHFTVFTYDIQCDPQTFPYIRLYSFPTNTNPSNSVLVGRVFPPQTITSNISDAPYIQNEYNLVYFGPQVSYTGETEG